MKKWILLSAFLIGLPTSYAQRGSPQTFDMTRRPAIYDRGDSVMTYLHIGIPGTMGNRNIHHRFDVWMAEVADTSVRRHIASLTVKGERVKRRERRMARRDSLAPARPRILWKETYRTPRRKQQRIVFRVVSPRPEWMEQEVRIETKEFHAHGRHEPLVMIRTESYTPAYMRRRPFHDEDSVTIPNR